MHMLTNIFIALASGYFQKTILRAECVCVPACVYLVEY